MTWVVYHNHVMPREDLRAHLGSPECWCKPTEDDGIFVHHSLDKREFYERKERLPS